MALVESTVLADPMYAPVPTVYAVPAVSPRVALFPSKHLYASLVELYELHRATYWPFVTPLYVPVAVNVF